MARTKLTPFWKNLELLSFENLTIITRTDNGRRKKYQFSDGYQMIAFYEKCTGMPFGSNRSENSDRLLEWR